MKKLIIAGKEFNSRLFLGTGKFNSNEQMENSILASGTEMVTVAMKRIELENKEDDIEEKTIDHFSQYNKPISLHDALAMFFMKYGPICSTGTVRTILKKLEGSGRLSVDRNPALTGRGKKATFMTEGKGKKVSVRWIR